MKILIVEDNKVLGESLKEALVNQGYKVSKTTSYEETLNLIKKEVFNLYIIDILLPDSRGYDLLQHFNNKNNTRFIFISGFFDESSIKSHIPTEFQNSYFFMKKPIDQTELLKQIQKAEKEMAGNIHQLDDSHKNSPDQSLKSFLSKHKTFNAQDLLLILFLAFKSKFSGVLELLLNDQQKDIITFKDGFINQVISEDKESLFGVLLIEHGLSLSEDILKALEDENSKDKYLGEKLVENLCLSPHMLDFILKEQIKIRLTKIISHLSFSVTVSKKEDQKESTNKNPEFNKDDLIGWTIDSLQTKIKDNFLQNFYSKNKYNLLKANHNTKQNTFDKKFIERYNNLFQKIQNDITLEDFLKGSKNKRENLELVYFGFLTESIHFINPKESKIDYKKSEEIINRILNNKTDNLFQILNVPWKASKEEVEKSYKSLIKVIHPDRMSKTSSEQTIKKHKEAFQKIQETFKILSDTNQREIYLKNQESEAFLNVLSSYEKGTSLIKDGDYKTGLNLLKTIINNHHAPGDTFLYTLWAKIQLANNLHDNKSEAGSLKKEIEKCSIDQRVSPLFWFVTGLYYKNTHNYEKALTLFKKTITLKPNFREAFKEMTETKSKIKETLKKHKKDENVLSRFFNKKTG